jgi:hypothetical protein
MLFVATGLPRSSCAQVPADRLCSSAWFATQRKEASAKDRTFQLVSGGLFKPNGNSYALAISHEAGTDGDLDFMVFAAPDQSLDFRLVLTERIDILDVGQLSAQESQCLIKADGVFFKVNVVDLAGDGAQRIVVESNSVGTCSSCLSEVRVYEIEKNKIIKVVDEYYSDIRYAKGQGLWVHSFRRADDGRIVQVEKSFFDAKSRQQNAR